jgi:hypothetical protein
MLRQRLPNGLTVREFLISQRDQNSSTAETLRTPFNLRQLRGVAQPKKVQLPKASAFGF